MTTQDVALAQATGGDGAGPVPPGQQTTGAPARLVGFMHRVEGDARLDGPVGVLSQLTRPFDAPAARQALSGAWLGHALHPLVTDFPLGSWASATLLDLFGGRRSRPAAQGLVAFGLACTVPTIASGIVEWRTAGERDQRVGVVHALVNTLATACYAASLGPRRRGQPVRTAAWSVTGGLIATAGGYFGGHLSLVRKVGSRDAALAEGPGRG
jgi:uncharacterized membrane protein